MLAATFLLQEGTDPALRGRRAHLKRAIERACCLPRFREHLLATDQVSFGATFGANRIGTRVHKQLTVFVREGRGRHRAGCLRNRAVGASAGEARDGKSAETPTEKPQWKTGKSAGGTTWGAAPQRHPKVARNKIAQILKSDTFSFKGRSALKAAPFLCRFAS